MSIKHQLKNLAFSLVPTKAIYTCFPKQKRLVILDNYFPNHNCGFKINEYNYLLNHFPNSEVYSSWPDFQTSVDDYNTRYPEYKGRVKKFSSLRLYSATLFYVSFLHNMYYFLPLIEREQTPFVFTLYGGGFFGLHYSESDEKLARICSSPWFRKVIVSQVITAQYLVERGFCRPDQVELVYGSTPSENQTTKAYLKVKKKYYRRDKQSFDICFVGRRHTPQGKDKGYHLFIAAAKKLASQLEDVRFHVVGNFDETIIPLGKLAPKIKFYGEIPIEELPHFFEDKDIYLSPNLPNQIHPGSFEGITGTCQEAAYAGTAVFCTDELKLNLYFTNKKDIVIISTQVGKIVSDILYYYQNLEQLYDLSKKGKKKFLEVFDFDKHMSQKQTILQRELSFKQ